MIFQKLVEVIAVIIIVGLPLAFVYAIYTYNPTAPYVKDMSK